MPYDALPNFSAPAGIKPHRATADAEGRIIYSETMDAGPYHLARLTSEGEPDDSFGEEGVATFPSTEGHTAVHPHETVTRPDGTVLLLAQSYHGGSPEPEVALIQFHENGEPDEGFGEGASGGKVVVTAAGEPHALALQADGAVLVLAADDIAASEAMDCKLRRYFPTGEPDSNFGTFGVVDVEGGCAGKLVVDDVSGRVVMVRLREGGGIELLRFWL